MPIDREAALRKAEKFLRQGRLDGAIEEYARLVDDQPRDWNAINALGDLYARAGDPDLAVAQFTRVADHLFDEGFLPKAAALYKKALKVGGHQEHALLRLGEIGARQGLLADARTYWGRLADQRRLRGDDAGAAECASRIRALDEGEAGAAAGRAPVEGPDEDPDRLFNAALEELAAGRELQARALLTRVLIVDRAGHGRVLQLALGLAREGRIESAFGCVDVVTDAAVLGGDWLRAIGALDAFVTVAAHIPALMKLVELCVDAGADAPLGAAQARLADAYLEAGMGSEARVIAEDLLEREPDTAAHAERRRRALALLGVPAPAPGSAPGPVDIAMEEIEVDLSDALSAIGAPGDAALDAEALCARAIEYLRAGREEDAVRDLTEAARAPRTRARAAAELGRLLVRRGDLQAGVAWLEQAADGPAATPEEACGMLYDLADALERLGEQARALAVFMDLATDAGGYRDVSGRVERLMQAQTGSGSL